MIMSVQVLQALGSINEAEDWVGFNQALGGWSFGGGGGGGILPYSLGGGVPLGLRKSYPLPK